MRVRMLMQVDHLFMMVFMAMLFLVGMPGGMLMVVVSMFMLMAVTMGMLMRMQMLVFVLAFHDDLPSFTPSFNKSVLSFKIRRSPG